MATKQGRTTALLVSPPGVPSPGEERAGSVGTLPQHLEHCQWERSPGCQHAGKEGRPGCLGRVQGWGAGGGQGRCRQS